MSGVEPVEHSCEKPSREADDDPEIRSLPHLAAVQILLAAQAQQVGGTAVTRNCWYRQHFFR